MNKSVIRLYIIKQIDLLPGGNTMSKTKTPMQLLSTVQVAEEVGKTKQWVHWAVKNIKEFPEPHAYTNKYPGWDPEAIQKFKDKMQDGSGETKQAEKVENK